MADDLSALATPELLDAVAVIMQHLDPKPYIQTNPDTMRDSEVWCNSKLQATMLLDAGRFLPELASRLGKADKRTSHWRDRARGWQLECRKAQARALRMVERLKDTETRVGRALAGVEGDA